MTGGDLLPEIEQLGEREPETGPRSEIEIEIGRLERIS